MKHFGLNLTATRGPVSALIRSGKHFLQLSAVKWFIGNVLPGVIVSAILVALMTVGGEIYIRATIPFANWVNSWPTRFDPRYGWIFSPGETVKWTNNMDFWTTTPVNSLGFLDREPPKDAYPGSGACRVAFIGDSFVEAAQVPVEQKIQSQLEKFRTSGRTFETLAFGASGTGQANQLPFYDVFASRFHPNVVVLVFVGNDFANNSSPLEAIRNGWDPLHPPRLFFQRSASGEFRPIPIDPDWATKVFNSAGFGKLRNKAHGYLLDHSAFYRWLYFRLSIRYPTIARLLDGQVPHDTLLAERKLELSRRYPELFNLDGWNFPNDLDMDTMFFAARLPPVFEEALATTGHVLDEFSERARRDGFNLVILADKSTYSIAADATNRLSETGQIDRLRSLAGSRSIPVVDLRAYILSIHEDPLRASFAHDGHWSPLGHQWAAQALDEYFRDHPEACERP